MSQVKRSVAVIGAGFGGMTASLEMAKAGWKVVVFEKEGQVGGLANGFSDKNWEWPLEKHYHHLFASDRDMIDLAKEIGHPISYTRPITSTYLGAGQIYQLDSPLSLLQFAGLSFLDRLRTGVGLAILRYNPFWQLLENVTAQDFIVKIMGRESWEVLWKPLFLGKFGKYADRIGAVWFWARIFTRTASLGYPQGGFTALALTLKKFCEKQGVRFYLGKGIESIKKKGSVYALG